MTSVQFGALGVSKLAVLHKTVDRRLQHDFLLEMHGFFVCLFGVYMQGSPRLMQRLSARALVEV